MSATRTIPNPKITIIEVLDQLQKIPAAILQTKEGVSFISLMSGILLEQAGFSDLRYRIKEQFRSPSEKFLFSEDEPIGVVVKHGGDENKACLSMTPGQRGDVCELKPKLNVEFDIWPWSNLAIPQSFGKFDLPVPKLLIILGTMGMSAEFIKGMGGIVPG